MNNYTYATLLSTDDYVYGVIGLYNSLQEVNTKYPFICIATSNLQQETLDLLAENGIDYIIKPHLDFMFESCYQTTLNKVYVWDLDYDKVLYLDGDLRITENIDYFFDYSTPIFKYAIKINFELNINVISVCGEYFLIKPDKSLCAKMAQEIFLHNDEEVLNKYFLYRYLPTYDCPQVYMDDFYIHEKRYWEKK